MGAATTSTTEPSVELEFQLRDRDCFFVEMSARLDARVNLEYFVNRSDGRLLEYFTIEDAAPDRVLSATDDASVIADARLVGRGATGSLFEFVIAGHCVATTLADAGALTQSVVADDGVGRVVADVPPHVDVRDVVETFHERYPGSDLVARHDAEQSMPVQTGHGAQVALTNSLTEKQLDALATAYERGYFTWPRESSADDCADALDIAQSTFSQHLRTAQEKVFGGLFDSPARE